MSRDEKVYLQAIVRLDLYYLKAGHPPENPIWISVKEVLASEEEADAEVARLNRLSEDRDVLYFAALARYYPKGRAVNKDPGSSER